jgi:hypothetical protein
MHNVMYLVAAQGWGITAKYKTPMFKGFSGEAKRKEYIRLGLPYKSNEVGDCMFCTNRAHHKVSGKISKRNSILE